MSRPIDKPTCFKIQRINRESFEILSVGGYMGNAECCKLEAELERLHERQRYYVIVDLITLTFITSASLRRLSKQARRFRRAGGELKLAGLPPLAARLVQVDRLEKELNPAASVSSAIKSLLIAHNFASNQDSWESDQQFVP